MKSTPPSPFLFQFTDYRSFLKSHLDEQKKHSRTFTLGRWAKELGLANTAVLTNVLNGKRNPGPKVTEALVDYFGFRQKEEGYFRNLILLHKSRGNPTLHVHLREKIRNANPKAAAEILDDKSFSAISNWLYYAVREMVNLPDFLNDPDWIVERLFFKVPKKQAQKTLEDLVSLGLLIADKSGKITQKNSQITTTEDVRSEAIQRFHEAALNLSQRAVREVPVEKRDLSSITFPFCPEDLPRLKRKLEMFRKEILEIFERTNDGEEIYQLNLQLIPLTQESHKSRRKS